MVRLTDFRGGSGGGGYNHLSGATYNRVNHGNFCISEKCAMWRWQPTTESVPAEIEGARGTPARARKTVPTQTHGYCGLAGRPEVAP